jgi:hypothetical protein
MSLRKFVRPSSREARVTCLKARVKRALSLWCCTDVNKVGHVTPHPHPGLSLINASALLSGVQVDHYRLWGLVFAYR